MEPYSSLGYFVAPFVPIKYNCFNCQQFFKLYTKLYFYIKELGYATINSRPISPIRAKVVPLKAVKILLGSGLTFRDYHYIIIKF